MAYASCITEIAGNIAINCSSPIAAGYSGRGVLIPFSISPTIVQDTTNPRIVTSITIPTGKKIAVIDNVMTNPFDGTSKQKTADNGRASANKTFSFRIPLRGAAASEEVVEPLMNSGQGYIAILEKVDKVGDGSYEVVGLQRPLKCTDDGATQSEAENGGDVVMTMQTNETWWECVFFDDDYATTKAAFETLMNSGF